VPIEEFGAGTFQRIGVRAAGSRTDCLFNRASALFLFGAVSAES